MAKIYSDKLPDCCAVCPCLDDLGFCELMNEWINKTSDGKHINCYTNRHPDCPIKPLSILEKQLALTEKALELACKELRDNSCMSCNSCNRLEMCNYVLSTYPASYFIEEAKEMMKSE